MESESLLYEESQVFWSSQKGLLLERPVGEENEGIVVSRSATRLEDLPFGTDPVTSGG